MKGEIVYYFTPEASLDPPYNTICLTESRLLNEDFLFWGQDE